MMPWESRGSQQLYQDRVGSRRSTSRCTIVLLHPGSMSLFLIKANALGKWHKCCTSTTELFLATRSLDLSICTTKMHSCT